MPTLLFLPSYRHRDIVFDLDKLLANANYNLQLLLT